MRALLVVTAALAMVLATTGPAVAAKKKTRHVLVVANNWEGTTDIVDPKTLRAARPHQRHPGPRRADGRDRRRSRRRSPSSWGSASSIGEGHDQFNDDVFSSHDGRTMYVSRPSLADVVGDRPRDEQIVWRAPVDGYRADHMAISPDGTRLLVSASTARNVARARHRDRRDVGEFASGDSPHENNYSARRQADLPRVDRRGLHAARRPAVRRRPRAIGTSRSSTPTRCEVLKRIVMGEKLAEAGYPNFSAAVRPMALSPDERFVYFQLSFFHGFVEYDLVEDRVDADRPPAAVGEGEADAAARSTCSTPRTTGWRWTRRGTKLCVAGTMSDYGAIVDRETFALQADRRRRRSRTGRPTAPTASTASSRSAATTASSVITYATEQGGRTIPVGDHPQRMRMGRIRRSFVR